MASINYEDERFTDLENDKQNALNQSNSTYDNLINDSKGYYDSLIQQNKDWADKQAELQNERTDFTIGQIEQQKDKAEKDYTKEQKGAYQDYMKQSNAYGSNMQTAGQQGLGGSGWAQTIQSGYYNTYQNRYARARESYNTIVMNYDNNIKEAQLQNSSALATIYAEAQAQQLELALQSFTVIKDLSLAKQNAYIALDAEYNDRWREIESQINTENALEEQMRQFNESQAEKIRQYNESLAEQKRQADLDYQYKQAALALEREQFNWQKSQANSSSAKLTDTSGDNDNKEEETKISNNTPVSKSNSNVCVKLSNGKIGYTSATTAYKAAGGGTPYNEATLLKKGIVKKKTYNGKTYYYYAK